MLIPIGVQLLTQLHDGRVQSQDPLFMVLSLLLPDAFSLLAEILLSLTAFRVLLVRGLFEGHLISIQLCFLVLIVVLGFRELFFFLKTSLLQSGRFLSQSFKHLLDIFGFLDRRFQFILPEFTHVFEGLAVVLHFVLFRDVEFLIQLVLRLLALEDPHQLQNVLFDFKCILASFSPLTGIKFIAIQRFHLLTHLLVDLGETIFAV